jgi:hypothetical protein
LLIASGVPRFSFIIRASDCLSGRGRDVEWKSSQVSGREGCLTGSGWINYSLA